MPAGAGRAWSPRSLFRSASFNEESMMGQSGCGALPRRASRDARARLTVHILTMTQKLTPLPSAHNSHQCADIQEFTPPQG